MSQSLYSSGLLSYAWRRRRRHWSGILSQSLYSSGLLSYLNHDCPKGFTQGDVAIPLFIRSSFLRGFCIVSGISFFVCRNPFIHQVFFPTKDHLLGTSAVSESQSLYSSGLLSYYDRLIVGSCLFLSQSLYSSGLLSYYNKQRMPKLSKVAIPLFIRSSFLRRGCLGVRNSNNKSQSLYSSGLLSYGGENDDSIRTAQGTRSQSLYSSGLLSYTASIYWTREHYSCRNPFIHQVFFPTRGKMEETTLTWKRVAIPLFIRSSFLPKYSVELAALIPGRNPFIHQVFFPTQCLPPGLLSLCRNPFIHQVFFPTRF